MGPRFCKRGNLCPLWKVVTRIALASMGPRFCKRGNVDDVRLLVRGYLMLQWGHAFVSVETVSRTVGQVYHLSSPLRPEVVRQAHILAG